MGFTLKLGYLARGSFGFLITHSSHNPPFHAIKLFTVLSFLIIYSESCPSSRVWEATFIALSNLKVLLLLQVSLPAPQQTTPLMHTKTQTGNDLPQ